MTVDRWGPESWFVAHPAFVPDPGQYPKEFEMSHEFAEFITGWALGRVGKTPFHVRNYNIAQRKSCYPKPLMSSLGILTEEGERVLARAQQYMKQITLYYESIGVGRADIPTWEQSDTMDTIVLAGMIEGKNIIFLKTIYNRLYPSKELNLETAHLDLEMPGDLDFEYREIDGREYMLTSPLRAYPHKRKDFELLVKLGLLELRSLPKLYTQRGKGRAPVGATLTPQGRKFYQDYLERYDPLRIAARKRAQLFRDMSNE